MALIIEGKTKEPIVFTVRDYSNGLPDITGMQISKRLLDIIPAPFDFLDPTIISRTFKL